jgi:hypothetical protein
MANLQAARKDAGAGSRTRPRRRYAIFRNPQLAAGVDQVNGLVAEGRFFRFRKPLDVVEGREGRYYWHEAEDLGMLGYGATRQDSWDMLIGLFEHNWDDIAMEDDSRLTKGARSLKRQMLRLVESVDEVR